MMTSNVAENLNIADGTEEPCHLTLNWAIRNARKLLGLSQREMASQLGCDYAWLSQLENRRLPIAENYAAIVALLPKLAELAEVDLGWLSSLRMVWQVPKPARPAFTEHMRVEL